MTSKYDKIEIVTLDEARKEIQKLVQQGVNFREIAQTKFLIGDRIKKFSIGEISKIKNESIGKIDESQNKYQDASFLFMLFDKGRHPTDIVIEYKLDPDFVQQVYKKYGEMKNMYLIPTWMKDKMFETALRISGQNSTDMKEAFRYIEDTVNFYFWSIENENLTV